LKILVLNYEYPPIGGGSSPISMSLTEGIARNIEKVHVMTTHFSDLSETEIMDNITIHRLKCNRKYRMKSRIIEHLIYVGRGFTFFHKVLKKEKFDMCHCHFIVPTGLLAYLIMKVYGLDYIITAHGSDVPGHNKKKFKLLHFLIKPITKIIIKSAREIIFPSNYLLKRARETIGNSTEKYKYIPNGIELNKFNPQEKKKTIVAVGRLISLKGFDTLLDAVSSEDIGYEIHLLGDGPLKKIFKEKSKESKTKVIVHGWVDNSSKEFKDILEQASVFCLPSERENASIALLEAMAAGCAIITVDNPGAMETVGDVGEYFKYGDKIALLELLIQITENEEKMKKMQLGAKKRIMTEFAIEKTVGEYLKVLKV